MSTRKRSSTGSSGGRKPGGPRRPTTGKKTTRRKPARRTKQKNLLTPGTIASVVGVAIVLALFVAGGYYAVRYAASPRVAPPAETVNAVELDRSVKAFFFDVGIDPSRVDVAAPVSLGSRNVTYRITTSRDEQPVLRIRLKKYLERTGFAVTGGTSLVASAPNLTVRFELLVPDVGGTVAIYDDTGDYPDLTGDVTPPDSILDLPVGQGRLAILLDDGGHSVELAETVSRMDWPIAVAVIPFTPYDRETARILRKSGKTVFLHQPMQPRSYPDTDPGTGALLVTMPELIVTEVIKKNMKRLGSVDGVNNHMGSAFTEDKGKMSQALGVISRYTDTFVDSRTSVNSQAFDACVETGMKCGVNRKFLDNDPDPAVIRAKLFEAAKLAKSDGAVIAIGHVRPATVETLAAVIPELEDAGITIVNIREVAP